MKHLFLICQMILVLMLTPIFLASGICSETLQKIPSGSVEAATESTGSYILEGKLLKIDGEFWIVEDLAGDQHKLHVGPNTTIPQSPKEPGNSIQAVVQQTGHAVFIQ